MRTAHGFVQGGDLVVETLAAFVETADLRPETVSEKFGEKLAWLKSLDEEVLKAK